MDDDQKEVRFDTYCPQCVHETLAEDEEPCDECLGYPANTNSRKPMYFKPKETQGPA